MGLLDFFNRKSSSEVAKDRLKLLLVSDRVSCSPEVMEMIKNDIIEVISKYMDIDAQGLDIQISESDADAGAATGPVLFANIPIREVKHNAGKNRRKKG
ncbi:MAG TPA: cell division topological specificity factor MinE [Candidatus Eisenbergiella merdavium]|uniref:Cell division topological specificity factor n=1 Tax=Candidatus Eisenbergiella merdavium TaxID=2838551 RepID=A0A9D2NI77_9FIRM|nr:cell division topological specificity factor MinE [Candidatus Eisenbergiella merdavium]